MDNISEDIYIHQKTQLATTRADIIRASEKKRWQNYGSCPFGMRWIKVSQIALGEVAKMNLGKLECSVFMFLLTTLHEGNHILVNQEMIANAVGNHKSHVCVALAKLIKRGLVEKTDGAPGSKYAVYHINPRIAWYGGDNTAHRKIYNETPPLAGQLVDEAEA